MNLPAYAKLNLTLDVLFRRPDGYHELDMLNLRVTLADEIEFFASGRIDVAYSNIPAPPGDTVTKAIAAYSHLAGRELGARVRITKRIPAQAGLGGGSADAAAILLALQQAYCALDDDTLHRAALLVGADVPYCLHEEPCRVGGIGELLTPLQPLCAPLWFCIAQPAEGVSTAALFSRLVLPAPHPDTEAARAALLASDPAALGPLLKNALQPAAGALVPEVSSLCAQLMELGALGAAMTGSGSAVFGLFASEAEAGFASRALCGAAFCCVCRSI